MIATSLDILLSQAPRTFYSTKKEPLSYANSSFLQGMEDVIVLDEMMQKYPDDRLRAFEQYSKKRNPDAEAMCDLAMYNYIEVGR